MKRTVLLSVIAICGLLFAFGGGTGARAVSVAPAMSPAAADEAAGAADDCSASAELVGSVNRTFIGFGQDGTLDLPCESQDHPSEAAEWVGYNTLVGDVDGNGRDDLIWSWTGQMNRTYVGLSNADGTLTFPVAEDGDLHPVQGEWSGYETLVGDVNGDGKDDLIWNVNGDPNLTYLGLSRGDGTFIFPPPYQLHSATTDATLACWGKNTRGQATPPAGTFFTQVSGGDSHTCGVSTDGTVACWGYNEHGQATPHTGTFTQVSGGYGHSCGVRTDGTVACWGAESWGQSTPPEGTFTQVSAGSDHTCGVKTDGALACWGLDNFGQVSTTPPGTFSQVSAGGYHNCGVKTDGTLACWGLNDYGQATPPAGTFSQVSAGYRHTCGVETDGALACWGYNNYGQSTPPAGTFTQVSAGSWHTCAVMPDGTLACWGLNDYGQSTPPAGTFSQVSAGGAHNCGIRSNYKTLVGDVDGDGDDDLIWNANLSSGSNRFYLGLSEVGADGAFDGFDFRGHIDHDVLAGDWGSYKTLVGDVDGDGDQDLIWNQTGDANITYLGLSQGLYDTISAGGYHNCGVKTDGTLACWGLNDDGQATPPAGSFTQVSAGYRHTCGVETDGALACWGYNNHGQAAPPAGTFTQVSAGGLHTCGVKTDGTLACWGWNGYGQATPPAGTFTQVSAGAYHSCGVNDDGTVACWGQNDDGESTPPGGTFSQVSAGVQHTCGVQTDGTLACWGLNNFGQATPPAGTFTRLSAGYRHNCGVQTDGTLACWGMNDNGQSTPPAGTFSRVSAGYYHTCGVETGGTVACWGSNSEGQAMPPAGTFTFPLPQEHPASEDWSNYKTLVADVDGDGDDDLIWNDNLSSDWNRIYLGLSQGDGTFIFPGPIDHDVTGVWGSYETLVGDVDGDGDDDLIWNGTGDANVTYLGLSQGDGTFIFPSYQQHAAQGKWRYAWEKFWYHPTEEVKGPSTFVEWEYKTLVGDVDGDGKDDLIWSGVAGGDGDDVYDGFEDELAQMFAPLVYLHSDDVYRPDKIENYLPLVSLDFNDRTDNCFEYWATVRQHLGVGEVTATSLLNRYDIDFPLQCPTIDSIQYSGFPYYSFSGFLLKHADPSVRAGSADPNDWVAYAHVRLADPWSGHVGMYDVQYTFFFPYNGKLCYGGPDGLKLVCFPAWAHEGDWEHITVRVQPDEAGGWEIHEAYYSAHSDDEGGWYQPGQFAVNEDGRPIVYAAWRSHALYTTAGTHIRPIPKPSDYTDNGPEWDTSDNLNFGGWQNVGEWAWPRPDPIVDSSWIQYTGRWGRLNTEAAGPTGPALKGWWNREVYPGHSGDIVPVHPHLDSGVGPPFVTAPDHQTADEGIATEFDLGSFDDLAGDPWTVIVDWGDGSEHTEFQLLATGEIPHQQHTYASPGSYIVTVTVTDTDGGSGGAAFLVTVGVACEPPFTIISDGDSDCDGAPDDAELGPDPAQCGTRDPNDPWDFYNVPVPTLGRGGDMYDRDSAVTILSDVLGVLEYSGTSDEGPPNSVPRDYDDDNDGDGYDDGLAYDRSATGGWSGPPDGAITILTDVLLVLAQTGTSCAP